MALLDKAKRAMKSGIHVGLHFFWDLRDPPTLYRLL